MYVVFSSYLMLNNHDLEKVTEGHSKLGCGFLFAFHSNYGSILHQFRDKAMYWSKIVIFSYLPCIRRPI